MDTPAPENTNLEAVSLSMQIIALIEAHQRMQHGIRDDGLINLNITAILASLAFVAAKVVNCLNDEEQRMTAASQFDIAFIEANHANEKLRGARPN